MFASIKIKIFRGYDWRSAIPVFRYAVGSTIIMAYAAAFGNSLSYIIPVLALSFFAPGVKPFSIKSGLGLVISLGIACFLAFYFSRIFLDFPIVFLLILGLTLLHIYYSGTINPIFRIWLIIAFLVIPLLSTYSHKLGALVSITLVSNAFLAVLLTLLVFQIFPSRENLTNNSTNSSIKISSPSERFKSAVKTIVVLFPVVILFYAFQWTGSLLILIFIAILSLNPQATSFKAGLMMILANLAGGIAAILAFNLLVIVPDYSFFLIVTFLAGLYFGHHLFSGKPTASLYATGFSTFLLVLGSVTSSDGDASSKVWTRIIQIGIAVSYVVLAFGFIDKLTQQKNKAE